MKKEEILKKLRDAGDYVSGQELCAYYGVSRTAVWKAVNQLKRDGYVIEAQTNRGYRLVESDTSVIFDKMTIESYLDTDYIGRELVFRKETGSTNLDAKAIAEADGASGTLVVADMQTAGRGRRGHGWVAPAEKNIYMTLLLRPDCMPDKASALTLVMAIAVYEAVCEIIPTESCGIKWPNDVVVNNKKICGILTEMSAEPECIHYVVTGAGINVNQMTFPEEIKDTATSLYLECGKETDRAKLVARVMHYFEQNYMLFEKSWNLEHLRNKYNHMLINMDRQVRVLDPKGAYDGIARGINEKGELIVVRSDNGETVNVYAGEVSVRGVYGYAT